MENLKNSFPEKEPKEIKRLAHDFYHHLCDLIVESVAVFSLSKEEALARFKPRNMEVLSDLYDKKRSVILTTGHYNNWELAAVALNPMMKHQLDAIYTPLTNEFFEKKFKASREKFGLIMFPKKQSKEMFEKHKKILTVSAFGIDQCPHRGTKKTYWMNFLNQKTAVMFGTEKLAKEHNCVVIYMRMFKVKRGCYEFEFVLVEEYPQESEYGKITEAFTRLLENEIVSRPEYWLWSHKRWKLKPEMMETSKVTVDSLAVDASAPLNTKIDRRSSD